MTVEVGVLITIIGAVVAVATFFIGRMTAAKIDGQQIGQVNTKLEYITDDLKEIKAQIRVQGEQFNNVRTELEVVKRDLKTAFGKIDDLRIT